MHASPSGAGLAKRSGERAAADELKLTKKDKKDTLGRSPVSCVCRRRRVSLHAGI
ncbi:MAG TPA: hypothetical protein VFA48_11710 [Gammaproteobacteria bacterium]|nr:hypothetical protein [Gammaproteobacteria bacterium]